MRLFSIIVYYVLLSIAKLQLKGTANYSIKETLKSQQKE